MLECGGKGGPMNRLFSLLLISLFTLVICPRTSSMPTSDEETLKNLEMEAAKHSGFSDADVAFQKSILGPRVISIDPLGHVYPEPSRLREDDRRDKNGQPRRKSK